jgi:MFS superfamily sulfate permease-like transporter
MRLPRQEGGAFLKLFTQETHTQEGDIMYTILLVLLILMLLGALPTWPYSRSWGYYPSGGLGLVVVIVIVLVLAGRL